MRLFFFTSRLALANDVEPKNYMSEEIIIKNCAPTLAGIKTGNIFSCKYSDKETLKSEIVCFNRKFVKRGLCLIPLRYGKDTALLYLYRPNNLQRDLEVNEARKLLEEAGYECESKSRCIVRLINRLCEKKDFPHEIGLFLSYPPEDVKGFIDNHAANYKSRGLWKVYGDAEKAEMTFRRYKKCTNIYCSLFEKGRCIEDLTVCDRSVEMH